MAARANSAALNAALNSYVRLGGYKNLNNALSNYKVPRNYNYNAERTKRRPAKGFYNKNANQTAINLNINRNIKKNLIRMGIKSAKPTKKERANAVVENARRRKATNVIRKAYIKSKLPGARKVRTRKVKEAAAKLNQERRLANLGAQARARANAIASARRVTVSMGAAQGVGGRLTPAAKLVVPSAVPKPPPSAAASRARPPTVNPGPALSASAREAMAATVRSQVTAPRAAAPKVHSSLDKKLKALGKK
jgi:hypothetical protein